MTIRVAIVRSREDVLAELIKRECEASSALSLVAAELVELDDAPARLMSIAREADVLIAIGNYAPEHLESVVEHHAGSVVSGILIGSDSVSMRLKKVGAQQLIDTLVALSNDRSRERSRLMKYEFVGDKDSSRGSYQFVDLNPSDNLLLAAVDAWLRLALLGYAARRPRSESDLPGQARGIETMQALLAPRRQPVSPSPEESAALATVLEHLANDQEAPLSRLHQRLGLKEVELKLLLLALSPELDVDFQTAFGLLNDDLGRRYPTFALACAVLGDSLDVRGEIDRAGNLRRWRLFEAGGLFPQADDMLRLPPALSAWVMGNRGAPLDDFTIRPFVRLERYPGVAFLDTPDNNAIGQSLARFFTAEDASWMAMPADHADRWRARCELGAIEASTPLLRCEPAAMLTMPRADQREIAFHLIRTARILGMVPVIDFEARPADENALKLLEYFADAVAMLPQCAILIAAESDRYLSALTPHPVVTLDRSTFSETEMTDIYAAAAANAGIPLSVDERERLAMAFPLPLKTIEDAVEFVALGEDREAPAYDRLIKACSRAASPNLTRLAHRITPSFMLEQVILPAEQRTQLGEIVGNVVNAPTVLNRWGFGEQLPYGRGLAVLFSGASGTGKTMASHAIAHELGVDIFDVDVSRLVSKYVGETEKNLDTIFTEAEQANAVIALQEVDSIAGRRGLQKDAHDRYANMEVAYLLQRIESFTGLAILTTNFKQNMDPAFLRRLRFSIDFPKPDARAREAIWRQCIPAGAPLAGDVDFALLARYAELTGGNIRQITLRAAFAAANARSPIDMRHILAATRAELIKLGEHGAVRELAELGQFRAGELAA
ncbi:ATP-binding protein [Bradyrhizobium diazoefficiens]|uniref:ATP-binding protein n=1 Tax=Bradyrhizobium diazoefficiens TaxID=1355477 RepID=UPI0004BA70D7|nr:ATP-binding protein [Bradyrhizobium diazoefficiens]